MNLFKLILKHKIIIIELLIRIRTLIVTLLIGDNFDLNLNDEKKPDLITIEENINNNDNNNNIISSSLSSILPSNIENTDLNTGDKKSSIREIKPNDIKFENNDIQIEDKKIENNDIQIEDKKKIDIEREKQKISDRFNYLTATALGTITLGTGIFISNSAPTRTKAVGTTLAAAAALTTSEVLLMLKQKTLDNIENLANNRPPSLGCGEFNLIDTNTFVNKILSIMNKFHNLDIDPQILILSILLLAISIYFTIYMFFFVVSPLLFDTIKDIFPIKVKNYMVKFISFNRKISVPFVILSFIIIIMCLSVVILALAIIVYFNYLNP